MAETKSSTTKAASASKAPAPVQGGNGLAIAALVVGIVAFVFGWTPFFGFLAGATAVVLGIIALKKRLNKGMSIAGIITGGLAVLWSIVMTILFVISIAIIGTAGVAYEGALKDANGALSQYTAENKALIDAKKDYKKGETATFGHYEVKVNNVKRDYVPEESYYQAGDGKEYVVVSVTVKNLSDDTQSISTYDFTLNEEGVLNDASLFVDVEPTFDGGSLTSKASLTGNIVFEVTKGADGLKLQYETSVYDINAGVKNLVYTLEI
jgi:hypothetical protein